VAALLFELKPLFPAHSQLRTFFEAKRQTKPQFTKAAFCVGPAWTRLRFRSLARTPGAAERERGALFSSLLPAGHLPRLCFPLRIERVRSILGRN